MISATGDQLKYISISDETLPWLDRGLNARTTVVVLGEPTDPMAVGVGIIDVAPGPGDRLRGMHTHPVDAINLVLEGAMYMDGVWIRPGQAKIVPADTAYGDALPGPDGVKFLEIFATMAGARPSFEDPEDQAYFEDVHGSALNAQTTASAAS